MNTHADKTQDGKDQSKQSGGKPAVQFVDNRPQAVAQRRLQEMANNSPQAMQSTQMQTVADIHTAHNPAASTIQRLKNVTLKTDDDDKKLLVAKGTVKDFKEGTGPGTKGWVGVEKYRAYYEIEDAKNLNKGDVGPLKNTFTNPEAGHVLAKQNGGNGGDPENIFAQDGGTNNGIYKSFEIKMRGDLNKYKDDADVLFEAYLVGTNIKKGVITDAGLSEASEISSDEYSSD
jgi:hypothetical protein